MATTTDVVRREPPMTGLSLSAVREVAAVLAQSGLFPDKKTAEQAFVAVLAGQELGIPPFAAMRAFHVIEGKPRLAAATLATLVRQHPRYDYQVVELTNERATIRFYKDGDAQEPVSTFTLEDARNANLLRKDVWQKFPRNMLYARAMSNGVGWHCPDVTGGRAYIEDEIADFEVVDVTPPRDPVASITQAIESGETQGAPEPAKETAEHIPEGDDPAVETPEAEQAKAWGSDGEPAPDFVEQPDLRKAIKAQFTAMDDDAKLRARVFAEDVKHFSGTAAGWAKTYEEAARNIKGILAEKENADAIDLALAERVAAGTQTTIGG